MKIKYDLIFIAGFLFSLGCTNNRQSSISITNLRCEYLRAPLGIDVERPRLSWELLSNEREQKQAAYQILVASDSAVLLQDKADLWNSGKVKSNQTNQVKYNGHTLKSRNYCYWKVRVWDKKGKLSDWSVISHWSVGLLNKNDWQAKWIGSAPQQVPKEHQFYINHGYRSGIASSSDVNEWIIVDLRKIQKINEIRLYPVQPLKATPWLMLMKDDSKNAKAYLFPLRFSIDVSEDENFGEFKTVADESNEDYNQKGLTTYIKRFNPVKARYVRVRISKLAQIDSAQYSYPTRLKPDTQGTKTEQIKPPGYAFALAELEVFGDSDENLALYKPVKESNTHPALQPITRENWSTDVLTDGFIKANIEKPNNLLIPPSPLLRKEFEVTKKVKRASLYVTALGMYEIRINGEKVGNHVLAPEWTDYHHRVQYQVYNVTALIKGGKNAIGAMLADGWYAGSVFSHPDRGSYGFNRRLLGQLEINYTDETNSIVTTDESWTISDEGPIRQASIFNGELYDANLQQKGWDKPGFNDAAWEKVKVDTSIKIKLSAQMNEPIKVVEELTPIRVFKSRSGTYIFDIGQNIAGWIELSIPEINHGTIIIRHGEVLNEDSTLYTENLRSAKQTDIYISNRKEKVQYEPRFTYHGFRYVEISGLLKPPSINNLTAKVVASSSPLAGSLETSHVNINKLWQNIVWTQRGNMHSIPTDCPQRDERAGWMGDAQVFSQTAIFNLDMAAFFTKWIRDIRDSQAGDGRFPDWAPQVGISWNHYNSPAWADAGVIILWRMYQNYGDTTVLAKQYNAMKKYIKHILFYNPDLIWRQSRGEMYGDWLNGDNIIYNDYPKQGGKVPDDIFSTAFFAYSTRIIAKIAKVLDKKEDIRYYDSLATAVQHAFIKEFISEDGRISGNTQAGYALALEFNLVPENLKTNAATYMLDGIKAYDYRISTGIQSTIRLMNQLSFYGYNDIAYLLLESRRFPSWLYSIDQGATTVWERWDGYVEGRGFQNPGMNSFNHYAIGAVGEWMYRHILGINYDEDIPGYRHFIIDPEPGGSILWAKGSYHSIAGLISVSWKKDPEKFVLDIEIPVNTSANVYLPAKDIDQILEKGKPVKNCKEFKLIKIIDSKTILKVGSGKYSFAVSQT
jgi:alpha-L-rhamnosidase